MSFDEILDTKQAFWTLIIYISLSTKIGHVFRGLIHDFGHIFFYVVCFLLISPKNVTSGSSR